MITYDLKEEKISPLGVPKELKLQSEEVKLQSEEVNEITDASADTQNTDIIVPCYLVCKKRLCHIFVYVGGWFLAHLS